MILKAFDSFKASNNPQVTQHTNAPNAPKPSTHFAGGSALILQMTSTFSSLAAPTSTTLSVSQIGASVGK